MQYIILNDRSVTNNLFYYANYVLIYMEKKMFYFYIIIKNFRFKNN